MFRILAVNPGSSSTKISVFDDHKNVMTVNINHYRVGFGNPSSVLKSNLNTARMPFSKRWRIRESCWTAFPL